jgi:hypothetical protein
VYEEAYAATLKGDVGSRGLALAARRAGVTATVLQPDLHAPRYVYRQEYIQRLQDRG